MMIFQKNRGFTTVEFAAIGFAILTFVAAVFFITRDALNIENEDDDMVSPTPTMAVSPTPINLQTWKTYRNNVHGYSVQYPPEWELNIDQANNVEDYQSESCCNTAKVTISNGGAMWVFYVSPLLTGYNAYVDDPSICSWPESSPAPDSNVCGSSIDGQQNILGFTVQKRRYYVTNTDETYYVEYVEPNSPGFGTVNNMTQYQITYIGTNIDANLTILDQITRSLKLMR
ncbi:hypothetical protein HGA91_03970 [candidate division WWE3 bacterium]|nr:hypothetical protein [candidate division WWE3 bacterium]